MGGKRGCANKGLFTGIGAAKVLDLPASDKK